MKKDLTELVFILDRSGSMAGLESDTIGGYNALLEKQKEETGEAVVTTVLFDDSYEILHDRIGLKGIAPITKKDYFVRGSTALLDAIGKTINKISRAQENTLPSERAEKVIMVITTDGMENASREFGYAKVREMIEYQKERNGWEFIFLGANIDAIETAGRFGIDADKAVNFHADGVGCRTSFFCMNSAVSEFRSSGEVNAKWKKQVDDDFKKRDKKR